MSQAEEDTKDIKNRTIHIQTAMAESAGDCLSGADRDHLRGLIRLTLEFNDYLERGSVEIATRIQEGSSTELFKDLQSAATDPFNKYDLEYVCGSIRAGVDSFCGLNQSYRILVGALVSKIEWSMISSRQLLKDRFILMFNEFIEETSFEKKCRLLLDLFKLQMVFATVLYE